MLMHEKMCDPYIFICYYKLFFVSFSNYLRQTYIKVIKPVVEFQDVILVFVGMLHCQVGNSDDFSSSYLDDGINK